MLLPNPWLILAGVLLLGAAYLTGDIRGAKRGADAVQVKWDAESAQRALRSAENVTRAQDTETKLQGDQDDARKQLAQRNDDLSRRLAAATAELRKRTTRPGSAAGQVQTASAGTQGGSTGAGLYADDAVFLDGFADTAQRVRLQRDECYAAYERADAAVQSLGLGKEKSPEGP